MLKELPETRLGEGWCSIHGDRRQNCWSGVIVRFRWQADTCRRLFPLPSPFELFLLMKKLSLSTHETERASSTYTKNLKTLISRIVSNDPKLTGIRLKCPFRNDTVELFKVIFEIRYLFLNPLCPYFFPYFFK